MIKEIKLKVMKYMVQDGKHYSKKSLRFGLRCITKEYFGGIIYKAHEEEYDSNSEGRNLCQ